MHILRNTHTHKHQKLKKKGHEFEKRPGLVVHVQMCVCCGGGEDYMGGLEGWKKRKK